MEKLKTTEFPNNTDPSIHMFQKTFDEMKSKRRNGIQLNI